MNISKLIDFFESVFYNIYGDNMEKFMNHNFTIGEITFANIVKGGTGTICHKNRKSHGIALFLGGERTFQFENKKFRILENTLFYFPKGSNYTIQEGEFIPSFLKNHRVSLSRPYRCIIFETDKSFLVFHREHGNIALTAGKYMICSQMDPATLRWMVD